MKDQRIQVFRTATFALIESLDAVVRLSRWSADDVVPDPLRDAAAKIVERLAAANRLAGGKFNGKVDDAARVTKMCEAMMKLDAAYVAYRRGASSAPEAATAALELEVGAVSTHLADLGFR
jgi:hypothetical protein